MDLVTLEDGLPTFSKEAKTIEDFKILISRDRGGKIPGDSDGRKKFMATKELAYIYWIANPKSDFVNNFPEAQRHEKICEKLKMPEGWKPDGHLQNAIETYKELIKTQTSKVLEEMKAALFSSQNLISLLRKRMDNKLNTFMLDDTLLEEDPEALDKVSADVNKLLKLSNEIPNMISTIEKLEEKVAKETSDKKGLKGRDIDKHQLPKSRR